MGCEKQGQEKITSNYSDKNEKKMFPKKYLPEDRLRQKIRQSSPELRALAAKLEQAYINKERAAQIAEKNLEVRLEEQRKQQEIQDLLEEKQYLEDVERKEILNEQISKLKYHQQLDEQLNIKEQEKIKVFQQFLKEKEQIDDVVRKIKRENEESQVQKMQQKLATKQQIEDFRDSQKVWREIEEQ